MRHELLTEVGVAHAVTVGAGDHDWERVERRAAVATAALNGGAEIGEEVGAVAVVADDGDVVEIERFSRRGAGPVDERVGQPAEGNGIALDLPGEAVAEHHDRGGSAAAGGGGDRCEEVGGDLRNRLRGRVLLEHGRLRPVGRGDRRDFLGLEAPGRVEQADDRAVGADHDEVACRITLSVDERCQFDDRIDAWPVGQRRQAVGVRHAEVIERRLDLPVVLGGRFQLGGDRRGKLGLEGGEVLGKVCRVGGCRPAENQEERQAARETAVQRWHHAIDCSGRWKKPAVGLRAGCFVATVDRYGTGV